MENHAMRVAIATKTWAPRNRILPIWLDRWQRAAHEAGLDAEFIICGSPGTVAPEGAIYIERPNQMIQKSNACLEEARKLDVDWFVYTGDDDLVSENFLKPCRPFMGGDFDLIGWEDLYFYTTLPSQLYYWPGYRKKRRDETIGAGRMLSRRLCEAIDWKHWHKPVSRNLDKCMTERIKAMAPWCREKRMRMAEEGVMMVDVKDGASVTSLNSFGGRLQRVGMSKQAERVLDGV